MHANWCVLIEISMETGMLNFWLGLLVTALTKETYFRMKCLLSTYSLKTWLCLKIYILDVSCMHYHERWSFFTTLSLCSVAYHSGRFGMILSKKYLTSLKFSPRKNIKYTYNLCKVSVVKLTLKNLMKYFA